MSTRSEKIALVFILPGLAVVLSFLLNLTIIVISPMTVGEGDFLEVILKIMWFCTDVATVTSPLFFIFYIMGFWDWHESSLMKWCAVVNGISVAICSFLWLALYLGSQVHAG